MGLPASLLSNPPLDPKDSEWFRACAFSSLAGPCPHRGSSAPLVWRSSEQEDLQLDFSLNPLRISQY